jgi:hypothetical protein
VVNVAVAARIRTASSISKARDACKPRTAAGSPARKRGVSRSLLNAAKLNRPATNASLRVM